MPRVVLVTGVARELGGRCARLLSSDPTIDTVVAVDVLAPAHDLGSAQFVRADIRNPVIAKVIARHQVDTVVHMNVIATPLTAGGRSTMKDINVIGTMQLLAACQQSPSVRKLVVKSSATVYGSSSRDPAMFTEEMAPKALPRSGFAKDCLEVEGYVRGMARRRPDALVTMLRFANVIGPTVSTPMTAYFTMPIVPTLLGHDARLQFVHEDDLLDALRLATVEDLPGVFNVAGDGVLMLNQAVRRAGRPALPIATPGASLVGGWFRRARLADFSPEQIQFLTYGRVVDTTRMRAVLGFEPRHTTAEAFQTFVEARCKGGLLERALLSRLDGMLPTPTSAGAAGA